MSRLSRDQRNMRQVVVLLVWVPLGIAAAGFVIAIVTVLALLAFGAASTLFDAFTA